MLADIIYLFIAGYTGGIICQRLRFPAARFIGAILAVGLLQICGLSITAPAYIKDILSVVLGVYLGLKFDKGMINQLKGLLKPSFLLIFWYLLITSINGYLLSNTSLVDEITAFLAVIPGGIAETSILAMSYNADLMKVTSFQMARLMTIVLVIPILVKKFVDSKKDSGLYNEKGSDVKGKPTEWLPLFVVGGCGGFLFSTLHLPAGKLIGAVIFVLIYNFCCKKDVKSPPRWLNHLAQTGIGGIIGTSFSKGSIEGISHMLLPILTITLLMILSSIVLAYILSKVFRLNFITSFLGTVPGGLMPMIIMASEIDADVTIVGVLQMVRLFTAITIIPLTYALVIYH